MVPASKSAHAARRVPAPLLLAIAALLWSGNFVLGRAVAGRVPPVALAFWRWAVALAVLLPFTSRALRDGTPVLRRSWKILCRSGSSAWGTSTCSCTSGSRRRPRRTRSS